MAIYHHDEDPFKVQIDLEGKSAGTTTKKLVRKVKKKKKNKAKEMALEQHMELIEVCATQNVSDIQETIKTMRNIELEMIELRERYAIISEFLTSNIDEHKKFKEPVHLMEWELAHQ